MEYGNTMICLAESGLDAWVLDEAMTAGAYLLFY
jgi:hypothetical protein